jgi:hypothetical protein
MGSASGPRVISGFRRGINDDNTRRGGALRRRHACTARFAMTLTAQAMQAAGLIYRRGRDFKILDRPGLETPHFPKLVI